MTPPASANIKDENPQTTCAITVYSDRASNYDSATGGWHVELGQDFAHWIAPAPGSAVLDLACGTGLVTLPMAAAVGRTGVVVGVDVTAAMLDVARRKELPEGAARVEWVEADITGGLGEVEAVRRVVGERGGFDVVSCCSALVLLGEPMSVVGKWASLLREGGRLIVDVPTEQRTLQYLFTVALREKLGMALPFDRDWVRGMGSLEKVYEEVGLVVEKSWKTRSYVPERWYEDEESVREEVFDRQTRDMYLEFKREGRLEEVRSAWREVWRLGVVDGMGRVYEGHPLYVCIGRRR
ncbi:MAG: hypothetical protein ASARMPREDX12_008141 [Alectoria sarmentosa]|nr:MAG: hypothetical protein ASARMPREDX12_008141 [Alectoria sarmentosa]